MTNPQNPRDVASELQEIRIGEEAISKHSDAIREILGAFERKKSQFLQKQRLSRNSRGAHNILWVPIDCFA